MFLVPIHIEKRHQGIRHEAARAVLRLCLRFALVLMALTIPTDPVRAEKAGGVLRVDTLPSAALLDVATNSATIAFMGI